jgi:hypothetical protein
MITGFVLLAFAVAALASEAGTGATFAALVLAGSAVLVGAALTATTGFTASAANADAPNNIANAPANNVAKNLFITISEKYCKS